MSINDPQVLFKQGKLLEVYEVVAEMLGELIEKESTGQGRFHREITVLCEWMDKANDLYWQAITDKLRKENAELRQHLLPKKK